LAIVGKNGTGKTTLLRVISGILRPYKGEVLIDDENIFEMNGIQRARKISYLPQFYEADVPFTVYEMVELGFFPHNKIKKNHVEKILEFMGIKDLRNKKFNELSGGQKQKVLIARSFAQNPEVFVFDEPSLHLDFENTLFIFHTLKNEIKRSRKNLIFVLHDINLALKFCDYVLLFIEKGKTVFMDKSSVLSSSSLLSESLGVSLKSVNIGKEKRFFVF